MIVVDEHAADRDFRSTWHQIDVARFELMLGEEVLAVNEGVLAIHVPAPAVERTDEALGLAIAVPTGFGKLDAAMAAGVVVRLHPVLGAHDDD